MLKKVNEKIIMSLDEAENEMNGKKGLFVFENKNIEDNMLNEKGYFTYISEKKDSFKELMTEFHKVREQGFEAIVLGEYFEGGVIGVLY